MRALPLLLPLLLCAGIAAHGSPDEETTGGESPSVRVTLSSLGSPSRLEVSGSGLRGTDGKGEALPLTDGSATLLASGSQVKLGGVSTETVRLQAEAMKVGQGRRARQYPGELIVTASRGRLRIVNETSLEQYTEGVLAGECPALFHPEAIRAMAVAARSYSYRKAFLANGELCDTVHCQVYRGLTGHQSIREAVRDTTGVCALYQGEVIDAVYSSDCGGYTEASEAAWRGGKAVPYLRPVEDAPEPEGEPYCAVNRGHRWSLTLTRERLLSLLGKRAEEVRLKIVDLTESGRVRQLQVLAGEVKAEAAAAAAKTFSGDQWRRLLGLSAVKSLKFDVKDTGTGIQLEGRGYGHGVGLCQFGANGMGKTGATHDEILKHYYTGIELGAVPPVAEARARFKSRRIAQNR